MHFDDNACVSNLLTPALPAMALTGSAVNNQATFKAPENTDEPSRACLMDLPIELRLHIYSFLLGGDTRPAGGSEYCCCCAASVYNIDWKDSIRLIRCRCASQTWPQILAVNKQVFSEAMPVLYHNFEMRITLPDYYDHEIDPNGYPFRRLLNVIPDYGRIHICQIAVVGSSVHCAIRTHQGGRDALDLPWEHITEKLPNIRNIRLHLNLSSYGWQGHLERIHYEHLARIASFPKLASTRLEVFRSRNCHRRIHDEASAGVSGKLETRVRAIAKSIGKDLSVVDAGCAHGGDHESQEESD